MNCDVAFEVHFFCHFGVLQYSKSMVSKAVFNPVQHRALTDSIIMNTIEKLKL